MAVAAFLAVLILASHLLTLPDVSIASDSIRAVMFLVIAAVVAIVSERISKANEDLKQEIENRREAEKRLEAAEERYRVLFESSPLYLNQHDREGRFLFPNPAMMKSVGIPREELVGKRMSELFPKEIAQPRQECIRKALDEGQPQVLEDERNGRVFHNLYVPLKISGQEDTVQVISRDITEQRKMEQEQEALLKDLNELNRKLDQSNKELQDFAYIASHDLREPLRKISSFGSLLQDSLEGKLDEDQQENFEFMIDGAQRMQTMINDLLTYSRVTTRAKPPERIDLNEVIKDLKDLELATLLDETKGTIRIPEPLPPVQGDLSQMHQLFQNLIGNGVKFHRKGVPPEITIRARQAENRMVHIEVQDNGIGIPEEYHEQLFTMFKRLHPRERYEGTGIGLAVCKKIVNRHGGEIGINSALGEGSSFWFTLPGEGYSEISKERSK